MDILENVQKDVNRREKPKPKGTLRVVDRTGSGNVENTVPDEGNHNSLFWKITLHSLSNSDLFYFFTCLLIADGKTSW